MPFTPSDEPRHVVVLVDCQNFYVSCERLFAPALRGVPVVVLSNNDGCIIARSEEAKALGIPMGAPYFKHRTQLEAAGAHVFSSNYVLYGDLSSRVMNVLSTFADAVEVYSIDEAFLQVPRAPAEMLAGLAEEVRRRVMRWTGIPTRVSIGTTKTLAKIGQAQAKARRLGVCNLVGLAPEQLARLLAEVPVEGVWGVAGRWGARLRAAGVQTALDLRDLDTRQARRLMNVVGARLVWELRGVACLPVGQGPERCHSVVRSRSFGQPVRTCEALEAAVSWHAERAAARLRRYGLRANLLQVFATAGRFSATPYYGTAAVRLPRDTNDTFALVHAARLGVRRAYRAGLTYEKAGVVALDLVPEAPEQQHLFVAPDPRRQALFDAVDAVNRRLGPGAVFVAASGTARAWQMRSDRRSPRYTTCWAELPVVR